MRSADAAIAELGKADPSTIQDFLDAVVHEFGGAVGLAWHVAQEYEAAGPGTQNRQRLLESILRLFERYGSSGTVNEEKLDSLRSQLDTLKAHKAEGDEW